MGIFEDGTCDQALVDIFTVVQELTTLHGVCSTFDDAGDYTCATWLDKLSLLCDDLVDAVEAYDESLPFVEVDDPE